MAVLTALTKNLMRKYVCTNMYVYIIPSILCKLVKIRHKLLDNNEMENNNE